MSKQDESRQIFIGNLHFEAEVEDVRSAFNDLGVLIDDVRIPEDSEGHRKGFAFVDISSNEPLSLVEIVSIADGMVILRRECRVRRASPRREDGRRGRSEDRRGPRRETTDRGSRRRRSSVWE